MSTQIEIASVSKDDNGDLWLTYYTNDIRHLVKLDDVAKMHADYVSVIKANAEVASLNADLQERIEAARSAVPELTRLQHIATKNAMLGKLKGRYDYDEKVIVGDIIHILEEVMWANTGTFEYPAALVAALEPK
jgi:hypothetical protein